MKTDNEMDAVLDALARTADGLMAGEPCHIISIIVTPAPGSPGDNRISVKTTLEQAGFAEIIGVLHYGNENGVHLQTPAPTSLN